MLVDQLQPGQDSYVLAHIIPRPGQTPAVARSWKFHNILRSVQWGAGGVVKNRSAFSAHPSKDDLLSLLDEAASRKVVRPSSYGDLFHQTYYSPLLSGPARRALNFSVPGAWQEMLLKPGRYLGEWKRYDIKSAYLWSALQGLPHPDSYRYSTRIGKKKGLYLCTIAQHEGIPYPFRDGGMIPVTTEEIDTFGLTVIKVHDGVTWSKDWPVETMAENIMSWSSWKHVARSFWGRYGSAAGVQCETWKKGELSKGWEMPNRFANPVWAHLIVGRIRCRLFEVSSRFPTARVYVDSVVIRGDMPTGENLGDWHLEETFSGLDIRHINIYSSLSARAA